MSNFAIQRTSSDFAREAVGNIVPGNEITIEPFC